MAILGLRSLYFALGGIIQRFYYLKVSLALLLDLIGAKMLLKDVLQSLPGTTYYYAHFEGIIPEGEYGGGTVMEWDRGTYRQNHGTDIATGLRRGELTFTLQGRKLKGGWSLVHLRARNWLLIKRRDRYASTKDITLTAPTSVLTGRTLAQIAADEGGDVAKAASGDPPKKARQS
jgi:ATP-dependent DNA ligase